MLAGAKPCLANAIRERIAFLTNVPTAAQPAVTVMRDAGKRTISLIACWQ
jgi:hypothetical protein